MDHINNKNIWINLSYEIDLDQLNDNELLLIF